MYEKALRYAECQNQNLGKTSPHSPLSYSFTWGTPPPELGMKANDSFNYWEAWDTAYRADPIMGKDRDIVKPICPPGIPDLSEGWVYLGLGQKETPDPLPPRFPGKLCILDGIVWSHPSHVCGWGGHCHYACAVEDWTPELQRRFLPPIPLTLPLEYIL